MIVNNRYRSFLYESKVYDDLKAEWESFFRISFSEIPFSEWIANRLPNGEEIRDGNPIYSALFEDLQKAVRIIQTKDNKSEPSFVAWKNSTDWNGHQIDELVISIQVDKTAFLEAQKIIKDFVSGVLLPSTLELANSQFELLKEAENLHSYSTDRKRQVFGTFISPSHIVDIILPLHHVSHGEMQSKSSWVFQELSSFGNLYPQSLHKAIWDLWVFLDTDVLRKTIEYHLSSTSSFEIYAYLLFRYNKDLHNASIKIFFEEEIKEVEFEEGNLEIQRRLEKISDLIESV